MNKGQCKRGHEIRGTNAFEASRGPRCRACEAARKRVRSGPGQEARFQAVADMAFEAFEAGYKTVTAYRRAALFEDLEWLIRTGEVSDNAARRLGYDKDALYDSLYKFRRLDLWRKLVANDPDWVAA